MFPIGILNSIFGYCKITSDAKNAESFLNLFMKNKIVNWKFQKKSGRTTFFILERDLTHLTRICPLPVLFLISRIPSFSLSSEIQKSGSGFR